MDAEVKLVAMDGDVAVNVVLNDEMDEILDEIAVIANSSGVLDFVTR